MNVFLRIYSIIIVLLLTSQVYAQSYPSFRLGVNHGLSNDIVRDIAQDGRGYIWLATEDGLNCFDGNSVTSIHRGKNSLPADELNCLLHDSSDSVLWIGTQREGLARLNYRTGNIVHYATDKSPNSLSANSITDLSPASKGSIWVSTYWGGVCRYIPHKQVFRRYDRNSIPGLPSNQTWTAVEVGDKLYIGHVYDGLSTIDLHTQSVHNYRNQTAHPDSLHSQQVFAIKPISNGLVWLGTGHGLVLFDTIKKRFIHYADFHPLLSGEVRALTLANKNELWISTSHSQVAVIDLRQDIRHPKEVTPHYHFMTDWSNQHIRINALLYDKHGNLWSGQEQGGASMIAHTKPRFNLLTYSPYAFNLQALTSPAVSALCTSSDGSLYVGLEQGGINVFSNGTRTRIYNKDHSTLIADDILMLHRTHDGTVWAGIRGKGLCRLQNNGEWQCVVSNGEIRAMVEARDGTLWVGTNSGVFHINPTSGREIGRIYCKVNFIWALTIDSKGQLWVGTFGGGIEVFAQDGKSLAKFNTDYNKNFPSNTICQLLTANNGNIYAATHEGLAIFSDKPKLLRIIDPAIHNINHHIQSMIADAQGNIWMGTYRGLACYVPQTDSIYSFRNVKGIPSTAFLPASATRMADGTLCFGSTSGLCTFSPKDVLAKTPPPSVNVTTFTLLHPLSSADDSLHYRIEDSNINLSHNENTLRINYAVCDFAYIGQVEYAYRLRGLSDEWYSSGSTSHVEFNNLPPGRYTFEVKVRILGEEWSEPSGTLHFRIKQAPWLSPWAIVLYICLALLIIALLYWLWTNKERMEHALHMRTEEKEHLEQEAEQLKRKATTIHEQQKQALEQAVTDNDRKFLDDVKSCIRQHIQEEGFNVAQMASELGMSESTLYRRLKALTGCSTQEWIRKIRMERAQQLLLDGKYSISEIGYMVGYSNPSTFRYAFKEEFGITPKAYHASLHN